MRSLYNEPVSLPAFACLLLVVSIVVSFGVGSFPTGLLVARARGIDIRAVGSGNIGATNVARSLGKRLGLIVLVIDACKGAGPVVVALALHLDDRIDPYAVSAAGLSAILGHCFSPWLGFRGGKGVATTFGVVLAMDPVFGGIGFVVFALTYGAFRLASLSSLVSALALPILMWSCERPGPVLALAGASACLIVIKHHANIRRLLQGQEHKV